MKLLSLCLFASILATAASAANTKAIQRRVRFATEVVVDRMTSAYPIPAYVASAARCAASLRVVKAGFIWGGEGSTGLVSCRTPSGWSAPSFFNTGGVNFGLQIGMQFLETVLLFMTEEGKDILKRASFQLGADLSFAAGPVGGGAGGGAIPNAHVLSYQRTVGLYAGATVNGFILTHDRDKNFTVYGQGAQPVEIFHIAPDDAPAVVGPFVDALETYLP